MKPEIHIGVVPVRSPDMSVDVLESFARRTAADIGPVLENATGASWSFHLEAPHRLVRNEPRRAADFLDEASLRMVEGPYDAVVVMTKGQPRYALDSEAVRWNAAALLLHLMGHVLGLQHVGPTDDAVMSPFSFNPEQRELPSFTPRSQERLPRLASRFPEREDVDEGILSDLAFHLSSAVRHPRDVLLPVLRSRAPLLPLHLPRLTTTALIPTFILVFTAEIWDAGFHMTGPAVGAYAVFSILASAVYLATAQNLFLPREEKRFHTEHLAAANVAILLTIVVATLGLFLMVGFLMLGSTWACGGDPSCPGGSEPSISM